MEAALQPTTSRRPPHDPADARALQASLVTIVNDARGLDVRGHEEAEPPKLMAELVPVVRAALRRSSAVLNAVAERCGPGDTGEPAEGDDFYRQVDALLRDSASARRVADLAFMARWEIGRKLVAIDALGPADDAWAILSECGSARRRMLKSAIAVETALCEHERLPSALQAVYTSELDLSVEVRRAYVSFRKGLLSDCEPSEAVIHPRLRAAAVHLAKLIGRDVYEDLRVTDRCQLRRLQQDIVRWLAGSDGFNPRRGLRLWQDLTAFAGLLVQVNNRAELRDHDLRLAGDALGALSPGSPASADLLARLKRLAGRDPEVDALLASNEADARAWRAALERVVATLRPEQEPAPPAQVADGEFI